MSADHDVTWASVKRALVELGEARSLARTTRESVRFSDDHAQRRVEQIADRLYNASCPKDVEEVRAVLLAGAEAIAQSHRHVGLGLYARDADGKALLWWHPSIVTHSVYTFLCKAEHSLGLGENLPRERSFPGGEMFAAHHRESLVDRGPAFWAYQLFFDYVLGGDGTDMRWRMDLPYLWVAERMRGFARCAPLAHMLAESSR